MCDYGAKAISDSFAARKEEGFLLSEWIRVDKVMKADDLDRHLVRIQLSGRSESGYKDHAGLEIPVDSSIASPFSRQIAIGNAGPTSALDSMGSKLTFRCHFLNIATNSKRERVWFRPQKVK